MREDLTSGYVTTYPTNQPTTNKPNSIHPSIVNVECQCHDFLFGV